MELVISILVGVFIMEGYAWMPNFSNWLLKQAVCRVHAEERERFREEWSAALNDLPNTMYRFGHALSIYFSVDRINSDFVEAKCGEIDYLISYLTSRHQENVEQLGRIRLKRGKER
jgi:hypothetical protein